MSTDRSVNSPSTPSIGPVEVRDRILDASRHLFGQRGYDGTSLREVAAAANVTKPMVYYYFGSKEGLFRTLLDEIFARFSGALKNAAALGDGRPTRERLEGLARVHAELARSRADELRLIDRHRSLSAGPGPAADACRALEEVHRRVIDAIVRDGLRSGELRGEADLLTHAIRSFMTSFHSPISPALAADADSPRRLVALLCGGIAAESSVRE